MPIKVCLGENSYFIHIETDFFNSQNLNSKHICLITSISVGELYESSISSHFEHCKIIIIRLPNGEKAKTWDSLNIIFTELLKNNMPRNTLLIALGGGVIGDITGLAASLYQRGAPYIQIPTTLLAQVDSSIGGKTAINHPLGKNMIGTFYQPKLVLININTLKTLPDREYFSGLAEIIKYGLITDADFFDYLETHQTQILNKDPEVLIKIIKTSCQIKANIISLDEHDSGSGPRALLNFGHTYGHAIETLTHYEHFLHGEAVAIGMIMAVKKSMEIFNLDPSVLSRLINLLKNFNLPTEIPENLNKNLSPENLQIAMGRDKKNLDGRLRLILLEKLGKAVVYM